MRLTASPKMATVGVATVYRDCVLREVSRLLSWEDREPLSRTHGCLDRNFWGWKFVDFPGARFQEGVYALAHLYARPFEGNPYHGNIHVLDWVRAGFQWWLRIQYRNGAFDEAYPFEHSLAATAFTVFYIGEAYLLLHESLSVEERERIEAAIRRAGDWLCRNDETHGLLSNHLAAAAAALEVTTVIAGDVKYRERSHHFLRRIYMHQSPEGWYEEYGGADPGYQTHGTFYLARIWQSTRDAELLESLTRSVRFLTHFIHPNGTLGGEYGSRNTEFYFPAGFEILAPAIPEAAVIARFMRPAVTAQTVAGLSAMDAYNFLPMLNNYLFAADAVGEALTADAAPVPELPCRQEGMHLFPDAGLCVRCTTTYYAILGLSKGGVVKVYRRSDGALVASDCGYWGRTASGAAVSSQSLNRPAVWCSVTEDTFEVETDFVKVNQRVLNPWVFGAFRLFTLTLGRFPGPAYWVKAQLVKVLVRRRQAVPLRLKRTVRFETDGVHIDDELIRTGNVDLVELRRGAKFATIHMGSSRYFQRQELDPPGAGEEDLAAELRCVGRLAVVRMLSTEGASA